jgi:beta-1,2-mannobiose phosphorylase / 1,2-beta-oligomannan phosphorylase
MNTYPATNGGWRKHPASPVLGNEGTGTCFDVSVLQESGEYRMYFSWRPRKSLALATSTDGVSWGEPVIVLGPESSTGWEDDINRPAVVRHEGRYLMWYTGQASDRSWIGLATSPDGLAWKRHGTRPVLSPELAWEKVAVMCPHVIWDPAERLFKMWYSGGEQYEPDAIGYATSRDGVSWMKHGDNPVFREDSASPWESRKVTACQVERHGGWYLMFYIGFEDIDTARIGIARSLDGVSGWERNPCNPIIAPTPGSWDGDACYKPFAAWDGKRWLLWYNGRRGSPEYVGLATHDGEDLGFGGQA